MIHFAYIQDFLVKEEAKFRRGYVPCQPRNYYGAGDPTLYTAIGASGVTIATGVDLGQHSYPELAAWGLETRILEIFAPYFGKKKAVAIRALHAAPFSISAEDVEATDHAVHHGYMRQYVIPTYEKASGASYAELPKQAQAVIMSLIYQKGPAGVKKDWPKTWGYLVAQDWEAASRELLSGFTQYKKRRAEEGRLLAEIL